jgi:HAD superfamily hydrolase (TIGR01549 family)
MNQPPKGLLFDFEGTLVDFQWRLAEAEAEALEILTRCRIPTEGRSSLHYAEAMNLALRYRERTGRSEAFDLLSGLYDRYDADALDRWQIRPGVKELLPRIRDKGLKIGLVSNVGRTSLDRALIKLDLRARIDFSVSRNEAAWLKPHPGGLLMACQGLTCLPAEVLYLGDSLDDILAARRAGVAVIIISGGQHRLAEIKEAGPEEIITDWDELLPLLKTRSGGLGL